MIELEPRLLAALQSDDPLEGLKEALGVAIRLEHSTIPPYLYALYSLQPGGNAEIAKLVGSVVAEEMAHMALACNILNAIGGEPLIDHPEFLPTYPGPLPGSVEKGLKVPLAPLSIPLVEKVFMGIEQPENPLEFPVEQLVAEEKPLTIGVFYRAITKKIEEAGESIFTHREERQVHGGIALPEVIPVHDVASAREAIEVIVEQGEGTETSPADHFEDEEIAHYYRFEEIVKGRELVPAPGQEPPWHYAGEKIPFEEGKVYPVLTNPKAKKYQEGTAARHACDSFNYTYTTLLKVLHETFNGSPYRLVAAVGLMESMSEQAQAMMAMPSGIEGKNVGPSFEWRPTNP